jgi:excisionase family DNA binding protein
MVTKIYTIEEVVEILKVTRRSVYNYLKDGKLNAVKLGRSWRVTEEELDRFIKNLK